MRAVVRRRGHLDALWAALAVLVALLTLTPAAGGAEGSDVEVVVEIDRRASHLVDPTLTRRLVAIELGDLEVPPAPGDEPPVPRSLFVRLIGEEEGHVRVELWELGRRLGVREVAFDVGTSEQLRARRIALVAAALGREAALARRREAQRLAEQARVEQEARLAAAATPPASRAALVGGLRVADVGSAELLLAGPRLEGSLRLADGATLGVGLVQLAGAAPGLGGAPPLKWAELTMTPGWQASIAPGARLGFGAEIAAATVELPRVPVVDGVAGQLATWTARAAGRLTIELGTGRLGSAELGVGAGMVLRPLPVGYPGGAEADLGGAWLALDAGWVLDPRRRGEATVDRGAGPRAAAPVGAATGSPTAPPPGSEAAAPLAQARPPAVRRTAARGDSAAP